MKKVVGVRHVTGNYEGTNYDNFNLYVVDTEVDQNCYGVCPERVKVKSKVFYQYVAADKIKNLINKELEIYYDAYKNVCKLDIQ